MLFYGEFLTKGIQKMGLLFSHYLVCKFLIQLPLQSKKNLSNRIALLLFLKRHNTLLVYPEALYLKETTPAK